MSSLAPDGRPLPVSWRGPMLNQSGYASEMRAMVAGLQARGRNLTVVPLDTAPAFVGVSGPRVLGSAARGLRRSAGNGGLLVQHVPGFAVERPNDVAATVARTMFETDSLHPNWVSRLNAVDEVWVPTSFNVDTFRAAGVTAALRVVPGGIEPDRYHPGVPPLPGVRGERAVSFLSVFEWRTRKGPDVLLRAWARAFGPRDDVELVLRTYPIGSRTDPRVEIDRLIDEELAGLGLDRTQVAPLRVLTDPVAEEDMPGLYTACDVFVLPTRGEGWGRPYLEAMAAGRPVIATDWSAHTEFTDESVGWLIGSDLVEIVAADGMGHHYEGQRWADPAVDHLTEIFRTSAYDEAARRERGGRALLRAAEFTWEPALDRIEAGLDALDATVAGAAAPPAAVDVGPAERPVRVLWRGDVLGDHSFARINRETIRRLADDPRLEIVVRNDEPVTASPWADDHRASVARLVGRRLSGPPDVEVRHGWPPVTTPSEARAVVLQQPWEYGGIPDDLVDFVRRRDAAHPVGADEVWVPTTFVRDCYTDSGVASERVRVLRHGVDLDVYRPEGPVFPLRTTASRRLLFVGGTLWRKGIDMLLDAYTDTFTGEDDVCLVIKASGSKTFYRESNSDARIRELAASGTGPRIEVIDDDLDDHALASLYRACDVLVHPFRGEGFAMTVIEAMACGRGVVATGAGAVLDHLDPTTAILVPARRRPVTADLPPAAAGNWVYEPDADALRAALQDVVEDPGLCRRLGNAARDVAVQRFAWDPVADQVRARLLDLGRSGAVPVEAREPLVLESDADLRLVTDAELSSTRGRRLLRRYLRTFDGADDVCLAFPLGGDAEHSVAAFERIVGELALDPEATADVLLVPVDGEGDVARLLATGDAVISGAEPDVHDLGVRAARPTFAWPEAARVLVVPRSARELRPSATP